MPVTEAQVRQALTSVVDPDLHRDIVSLGFVKAVEIAGGKVNVRIELTTPACPVKDQLKAQARLLEIDTGIEFQKFVGRLADLNAHSEHRLLV